MSWMLLVSGKQIVAGDPSHEQSASKSRNAWKGCKVGGQAAKRGIGSGKVAADRKIKSQ